MTPDQAPVAAASSAAGSIYDLGYQRYDGPRLGRRHAVGALFLYSLRACFGIGRGGRAKIAPIGLFAIAVVPAIVAIGIQALISRAGVGSGGGGGVASPISYDTYYNYIGTIIMLFVAAQAPELLGRDQRYQVLSLYFSRALLRIDYAIAKAAAFTAAILVVVLVPQAIIFVGLVLSDTDVLAALGENLRSVPPIIAEGLAIALLLGSIGLAIAAYTPRRAYATAAIIAAFIVPGVVAAIVSEAARGEFARYVVLASPMDVLEGLNAFFFDSTSANRAVMRADLPGELYLLVAAIAVVVLVGLLVRRYQRIAA
jgi:ABC-2 type transport system permease protein